MLSQRIYGLASGYEDINDHEQLRKDPVFGILAGRNELEEPLAGKSTLNRMELTDLLNLRQFFEMSNDHRASAPAAALLADYTTAGSGSSSAAPTIASVRTGRSSSPSGWSKPPPPRAANILEYRTARRAVGWPPRARWLVRRSRPMAAQAVGLGERSAIRSFTTPPPTSVSRKSRPL